MQEDQIQEYTETKIQIEEGELDPLLQQLIKHANNNDLEFSKGDSSAKEFAQCIVNFAEKSPDLLFKNIAYIVPFLQCDSVSLRNAILSAYVEIIEKCFDSDEIAENLINQRHTMLHCLQDHIFDNAALVRSRVLHLLDRLASSSSIPVEQFRLSLVSDIVSRLYDNSVMVRKAASNCLISLLECNPFGSNLSYDYLYDQFLHLKEEHITLLRTNPETMALADSERLYGDIAETLRKVFVGIAKQFSINDPSAQLNSAKPSLSIAQAGDAEINQLELYAIAKQMVDEKMMVPGCISFFELYYNKRQGDFSFCDGLENAVDEICLQAKDLILHYLLAQQKDRDHLVLMEEDRQAEYATALSSIEEKISSKMDALLFSKQIEQCLTSAIICVRRAQPNNELEDMIKLISECVKFKIRNSSETMKQVFVLIWRKDDEIVKMITEAGYAAFFSKNPSEDIATQGTLQNLMEVLLNATDSEWVSLEETFVKIFSKFPPSRSLLTAIWNTTNSDDLKRRLFAVKLIVVVCRAQRNMIRPEFDHLIQLYRTKDETLRIEALKAVTALAASEPGEGIVIPSFRIPSRDMLVRLCYSFVLKEFPFESAKQWIAHCSQAVTTIYAICARPYIVFCMLFAGLTNLTWKYLIEYANSLRTLNTVKKKLAAQVIEFGDLNKRMEHSQSNLNDNALRDAVELASNDTILLRKHWELCSSRFLHFIGEVAMKFLSYLEVTFTQQIKTSLQAIREIRKHAEEGKQFYINGGCVKIQRYDRSKDYPLIQFEKDCIKQKGFFEKADREDDRIGLTAISEEDKLQLKLQKVMDIDTFSRTTIIGRVLPFLVIVLKTTGRDSLFNRPQLRDSALLCLAKLMLINRKCCRKFLPIFLSFYNEVDERMRNNMLIMMTDLCFRFPNVFSKFNDEFIKKINDENSGVRYTCLLVLTHLILADLIKVSNKIPDLAPSLLDEDNRISSLARSFFSELSMKHNVLYNILPSIITKFVMDDLIPFDKFIDTMSFILKKMNKDQKVKILELFTTKETVSVTESNLSDAKIKSLTEHLRKEIAKLEKTKEKEQTA